MTSSCCKDFEEHCKSNPPDGFRIHLSLWMTPHETKTVFLDHEVEGQPSASVMIHFCPWCGRDLETTRKS
jgi:hypothetical protein